MKFADALDLYVTQLRADGRSAHTIAQYRRHIGLLARHVGERDDVGELTHQDLARFLVSDAATKTATGEPKKALTVNAIRSSLRTFFGYLHAAGVTSTNPARLIRRAICGTPPPRGLSDDEQRRLLAVLAASKGWTARRDRVLFELMLRTGIRLASALALDVRDVDLERGELTLRRVKGDRVEVVFLGAAVREVLAPHVRERQVGPAFVSRHGRRLSARQVQRRLGWWLRSAGVERASSPHQLRHAFAMALYARTRDLLLVRDALAHRSLHSTLRYARATADDLRRAL